MFRRHCTWAATPVPPAYIIGLILLLAGTEIKATKLTSVAMKEANSDVIEVRLAGGHNGLEVLQNEKTLSFTEQSWMDLHGENHSSDSLIRFIKHILIFFIY